jgi:putative transposase
MWPWLEQLVLPGYPHHVTQRGNRRQQVFFRDADYAAYLALLGQFCPEAGLAVWAYCLMPNHVHLIVVPATEGALRAGLAEPHRRYTRLINFRKGWRGHLWRERFASFVLDKPHLLAAVRYVENNPVRAGLVKRAEKWRWSSAAAHLSGRDDALVTARPMLELVETLAADWRAYLALETPEETIKRLQSCERTGRPCGSTRFVRRLEKLTGRPLAPGRPGRPKKQ